MAQSPKRSPHNKATLMCVNCGEPAPAHITLAANNEGEIHLLNVDEWPTYYWDTLGHRDEFCSAACVLHWLTNKSHTP